MADHLKACSACGEFVAQQRAVWRALDGWEAPAISADFDRRLFARLEEKTGWWERWAIPLRALVARRALPIGAAACLIVAAGLVSMRFPAMTPRPEMEAVKVENLQPEQVEHALDDLQMLSDFTGAARADAGEL